MEKSFVKLYNSIKNKSVYFITFKCYNMYNNSNNTVNRGGNCMYDALEVAKLIITICDNNGIGISNLKLQKLLYFLWVDFYKETNEMLFDDDICAWELGPVIPDVYYEFCPYGGKNINPIFSDTPIIVNHQEMIRQILLRYQSRSAGSLVNKTHEIGTPWHMIFKNGLGNKKNIPKELIIEKEIGN